MAYQELNELFKSHLTHNYNCFGIRNNSNIVKYKFNFMFFYKKNHWKNEF